MGGGGLGPMMGIMIGALHLPGMSAYAVRVGAEDFEPCWGVRSRRRTIRMRGTTCPLSK